MQFTHAHIKRNILAITFYVFLFAVTCYFERSSPGGPCVPGGGFMFLMLQVPLAAVLFLITLYRTLRFDKLNITITLIHLTGFLTGFYWLRSM